VKHGYSRRHVFIEPCIFIVQSLYLVPFSVLVVHPFKGLTCNGAYLFTWDNYVCVKHNFMYTLPQINVGPL